MAEGLGDRLTQLERAVRRAADLIARLKAEQATLEKRVAEQARELDDLRTRASASAEERSEMARLRQERKEVLAQVDSVLKELEKLEGA